VALTFPNLPTLFPFGKRKKDSSKVAYASFSVRSFAMTFDLLLLFLLLSPFYEMLSHIIHHSYYAQQGEAQAQRIVYGFLSHKISGQSTLNQLNSIGFFHKLLADYAVQMVISGLLIVPAWIKFATTPGLWLMRVYLADATTGGRPSWRQCAWRYVATILSVAPLMLGMLWMFFNPRKQAVQDVLANTVMLRRKFRFEISKAEDEQATEVTEDKQQPS